MQFVLGNSQSSIPYIPYADKFVCNILPESPTRTVLYTPGNSKFLSPLLKLLSTLKSRDF